MDAYGWESSWICICSFRFYRLRRAIDRFAGFTFGFFLFFGLAAVVELFAFAHRELAFCHAVAEINLQRDDGHALLLNLHLKLFNLAPIEKEFAFPERVVVSGTARQVFRNMRVNQPSLGAANLGESVTKGGFAFAEGFNLGSYEYQSCLEFIAEGVIVRRGAILRDNLDSLVLLLLLGRAHGLAIIAGRSDNSQATDSGRVCETNRAFTGLLTKQALGVLVCIVRQRWDLLPHHRAGARLSMAHRSPYRRAFLQRISGLLLSSRAAAPGHASLTGAARAPFRLLGFGVTLAFAAILLAGCPKSNTDFQAAKKAEAVQDYDTALVYYERALRDDPTNAEYKLRASQMRFEDGQFHVDQGRKAVQKGDLQRALAEFEKAQAIDPSSSTAEQEVKKTMELIAAQNAADAPKPIEFESSGRYRCFRRPPS